MPCDTCNIEGGGPLDNVITDLSGGGGVPNPFFGGTTPQIETNLPDLYTLEYGPGDVPPPSADLLDRRLRDSFARSGFTGTFDQWVQSLTFATDGAGSAGSGSAGVIDVPIQATVLSLTSFLRTDAIEVIPWWAVFSIIGAVLIARRG